MQNPMAAQVHYSEYQRQAAWINELDWQFEKGEKRHGVRKAIAQVLIALAARLAPTVKQPDISALRLAQ
jgi:hypothetical protein